MYEFVLVPLFGYLGVWLLGSVFSWGTFMRFVYRWI
jgi:hypothetical protein